MFWLKMATGGSSAAAAKAIKQAMMIFNKQNQNSIWNFIGIKRLTNFISRCWRNSKRRRTDVITSENSRYLWASVWQVSVDQTVTFPYSSEVVVSTGGPGDWKNFTFSSPNYADKVLACHSGIRFILWLALKCSTKWQVYGHYKTSLIGRKRRCFSHANTETDWHSKSISSSDFLNRNCSPIGWRP